MTLLYTQGFDGFASSGADRTDLDVEFDFDDSLETSEAGTRTGRTGTGLAAWTLNGSNANSCFRRAVSAYSQEDDWVIGFAFYTNYNYSKGATGLGNSGVVYFLGADGQPLCCVTIRGGTFQVRSGGLGDDGTVIGYANAIVLARVWYYFECKVNFNASGSMYIHLNEEEVYGQTGINTVASSTVTYPAEILIGFAGNATGVWVDDLYICDDQGSSQNDFLGDVRLTRLNPDGAGASTQFTADTGSNYARVNESDPDDDSSYVESNTATEKDTYTFDNLSVTPAAIEAVTAVTYCKKSDGGSRNFVHVARSSAGAEDDSAVIYPSAETYRHLQSHFVTDPTTGVAWTAANVNGAQFGFKVNA